MSSIFSSSSWDLLCCFLPVSTQSLEPFTAWKYETLNNKIWNIQFELKSVFCNIIFPIILTSFYHLSFKIPLLGTKEGEKKKREREKSEPLEYVLFWRSVPSVAFKRMLYFKEGGNQVLWEKGMKGKVTVIISTACIYILLAVLPVFLLFCFLLLEASASCKPLKSTCWESVLHEMLLSAKPWNWLFMHQVVTRV